jgi:tetratricopeptide (TPR) repeat protein
MTAREALTLGKRDLGEDHPSTLASVNNLAVLYEGQGRYGEAEPLYVRALDAGERMLGKDHPQTLATQLNLAAILINLGSDDKALRELRRIDQRLRLAADAFYRLLLGTLDTRLVQYDRLYIAPDGVLDPVAFARLVVPDGRYWAERQDLRQVRVGRDLAAPSTGAAAAGGMVVYGGVDYSAFSRAEATSPAAAEPQEERAALPMSRRLRNERGDFKALAFTAPEAEAVANFYWDYQGRKAEAREGREATEGRLKALPRPPRVLHLATHGFFLTDNGDRTARRRLRPLYGAEGHHIRA